MQSFHIKVTEVAVSNWDKNVQEVLEHSLQTGEWQKQYFHSLMERRWLNIDIHNLKI